MRRQELMIGSMDFRLSPAYAFFWLFFLPPAWTSGLLCFTFNYDYVWTENLAFSRAAAGIPVL
jgi:hypothetical protein